MFEKVWKGTTEDGYIELPSVNILSNLRFENVNDINLIESVTISCYSKNSNSTNYKIDWFEQIPTCIFKQLQDFYEMGRDSIPYFIFKYGIPIHYQFLKLHFKYKPNVNNKDISILVNVHKNLNDLNSNFQTLVYYVKEVEIKNDEYLKLYDPAYFFIPEKKMDNVVLKLNRHHIKLKYDEKKKIVPLVNSLNFNNYANFMVNFKSVDCPKMAFSNEKDESIKAYFVCIYVYRYIDGYCGVS